MITNAPLVYILTLNWNRRDDTLAFLQSCRMLHYPNTRLLVVDNGSTDDSLAAVRAQFPRAETLATGRNLGFAAGANVGLRHALAHGAAYVFLANNDTLLAPDALTLLVEAAQQHAADLVSPVIYFAEPPERVWWLGGRRRSLTLEISRCVAQGAAPFEVDFVTGCGMLISRRCLERVGLFDERFFMYYEDSDYCLRVRAAGLRVLAVPQAKMWHKVSTSIGGSDSPSERYHMAVSSLQFFRKHVRGWRWLLVGPFRAGSAVKTLVRLLARGRPDAARAYLRGLRDGARV